MDCALNIIYLLFLVPGGMFVAIVIAVFEFTWKQRKLAVDENVSNNSIKLSCTVHTVYAIVPTYVCAVFFWISLNVVYRCNMQSSYGRLSVKWGCLSVSNVQFSSYIMQFICNIVQFIQIYI